MRRQINLEPIREQHCDVLVAIVAHDKVLRKALGRVRQVQSMTPRDFFEDIQKWQIDNHADTYTIRYGKTPIGIISLSHQNGTSARVGYWLTSVEWGKGYATEAFSQLVAIARQTGFTELSASIDSTNLASKQLWNMLGASFERSGDCLTAILQI